MKDSPQAGTSSAATTRLIWSEEIGKRVRDEPWASQAVSTVQRIEEALDAAQPELAAQLVDYFMEEAKACHNVYQSWTSGFERWICAADISPDDFDAERRRLAQLLGFPDGTAFEPRRRWAELAAEAGYLTHGLRGQAIAADQGRELLEELRSHWQELHDRWVDSQAGLLTFIAQTLGEAAVGNCYREVLKGHLEGRYGQFDARLAPYEDTVERNLYLVFEAMRGHLSGPGRLGDLTVTENDDSWTVAFDPCGSGGRQARGGGAEAFGYTTERHDWAWNELGVCYYCAHCCMVNEMWPIEQWGAPLRVVDSPLHPHETQGGTPKQCTWTVYKTFDAIPDEAYERLGKTKPARAGLRGGRL